MSVAPRDARSPSFVCLCLSEQHARRSSSCRTRIHHPSHEFGHRCYLIDQIIFYLIHFKLTADIGTFIKCARHISTRVKGRQKWQREQPSAAHGPPATFAS